jgi:hypothetical protein
LLLRSHIALIILVVTSVLAIIMVIHVLRREDAAPVTGIAVAQTHTVSIPLVARRLSLTPCQAVMGLLMVYLSLQIILAERLVPEYMVIDARMVSVAQDSMSIPYAPCEILTMLLHSGWCGTDAGHCSINSGCQTKYGSCQN